MKELYFTRESITQESLKMLESLKGFRERHPTQFRAGRSALLILDMQRYFLEETSHAYIPSAAAIIPRIRQLIAAYTRRSLLVVFTRHLNSPSNAGQMAHWWHDLITKKNTTSALITRLGTGIVLKKSQYDAFYKTRLEQLLLEKRISQLVICGVMTHLCCESTARSAFARGFEVFFTIDGTATYSAEFHRATLLNLAHGFAYPVLVSEILSELKRENDN